MTSEKKIAANRRNASRSSGPRSKHAKMRTRRNALRHGLAVIALREQTISAEGVRLADAICGPNGDPLKREYAITIAENELVLIKVGAVRSALMEKIAPVRTEAGPSASTTTVDPITLNQLKTLDRYECIALGRRNRAIRALSALH